MHTIHLKIHDKVYDKFLWFLSKFQKEEIEIINEDKSFTSDQRYLQKELDEMENGNAVFYSHEELEERLEKSLKKFEDHL
jgi:tyrosyl-tRNA synthetase